MATRPNTLRVEYVGDAQVIPDREQMAGVIRHGATVRRTATVERLIADKTLREVAAKTARKE